MGARASVVRAIVGLCAFGSLLALPSGTLAGYTHPFLSSFGSFAYVAGVAADSSTGDVYVYDGGQGELLKFDASGNPANFSSTGTNATKTESSFSFAENEIAVDSSSGPAKGDIYVAHADGTIEIFNSAGENIGALSEEAGVPWGEACGVAVDASGDVYVGLYSEHINKYVPTGNPVTNADYSSSIAGVSGVCNVGADSLGNAYSITWSSGPVTRYDPSQFGSLSATGSTVDGKGNSMAVDPATDEVYVDEGSQIAQFGPNGEPFEQPISTFAASGPGAISGSVGITFSGYNGHIYASNGQGAINVYGPGIVLPDIVTGEASSVQPESATVSGTANPVGVAVTECKFEYGTSASYGQSVPCAESPAEIGTGSSPVQVHANLTGLTSGTSYHYRLAAANANGTVEGEDLTFNAPAPPAVSSLSAFDVARTEADVGAQVNPSFAPTTYHVEYGTSTAYGQSTPESQPLNVLDNSYHTVKVRVAGLTPGATYHFRVVATNAFGSVAGSDVMFTTHPVPSSGAGCANQAHREEQSSTSLSDCRAYEMVSPVQKDDSDINPAPAMAAVDGSRLFFVSRGSFAGQPTSLAVETTAYLATRGSTGWTTQGISLPNGEFSFVSDGYQGFDPDLSKGIINWIELSRFGTYDPSAKPGDNAYMRDTETGAFELLNGTLSSMSNDEGFMWGSSDFGKLALTTRSPVVSGTPCDSRGPFCAWEWDHGTLKLASVLPNGEPTNGVVGGSTGEPFICNFEHAMSDDGARLFFTAGGETGQLYARENGTTTSLISGSERTLPGGATGFGAHFQSAEAAHGNRVLFTTRNSLVNADTDETDDLYMYDYTKPAGHRLTLVSEDHNPEAPEGAAVNGASIVPSSECGGVAGTAEDLRRVYFVANNQIVQGAPTAPGPKLYVWDDTGASPRVAYVATLKASDEFDWIAPAVSVRNQGIPRSSRWSRDGRYIAFFSTASLTGFENEGERELYRYDAVSGSLDCVTCNPEAVPVHGEISFGEQSGIKPVNHMPQNVSDSGQVFFQTTRGLTLHDSNGQGDVYEYDGELHLISKGTGDSSSLFVDAAPTGSDVFFATRDRLAGWDKDGFYDVYDARVDGGLPEPPSTLPPCEGEACLAAAALPNDATPASATFNGAGDLSAAKAVPRCKAGQARMRGVCPKKKRARHKKHRRHHRPTTRSHG